MADNDASARIGRPHLPQEIIDQILVDLTALYDDDPVYQWTQLRLLNPYLKQQIETAFRSRWLPKMILTLYHGERVRVDYTFARTDPNDASAAFFEAPDTDRPPHPETHLTFRAGDGAENFIASIRLELDEQLVGNFLVTITDLPGIVVELSMLECRITFRWRDAVSRLMEEAWILRGVTEELLDKELEKFYLTAEAKEASITSRDAVPSATLVRILSLNVRPKLQRRFIAHRLGVKLGSSNIHEDSESQEDGPDGIDYYQSIRMVQRDDPPWGGCWGGEDDSADLDYVPNDDSDSSSDSESGLDDSDDDEELDHPTMGLTERGWAKNPPALMTMRPALIDPHREQTRRVCDHEHTVDWPCCRQMLYAFCMSCQPTSMLQLICAQQSMVPLLPEAKALLQERDPEQKAKLQEQVDELYLDECAWWRVQDVHGLVLRESEIDEAAMKMHAYCKNKWRNPDRAGGLTEAEVRTRFRDNGVWLRHRYGRMLESYSYHFMPVNL